MSTIPPVTGFGAVGGWQHWVATTTVGQWFNPANVDTNTSWQTESRPHSIPSAMIGAAMLWMGWFGFNAGSAVSSGHAAGHTLLCTHIAASICGIVWMIQSIIDDGKPSIVPSLNMSPDHTILTQSLDMDVNYDDLVLCLHRPDH